MEEQQGKSEELQKAPATEIAFESDKWKAREGRDYPYRNAMLEDLMNSRQLVGDKGLRDLDREQILNLLGAPQREDNNHLFYGVEQKRLGLWPLHTRTLVIQLSEKNEVNWVRIHE